jgi:hypothetical protein
MLDLDELERLGFFRHVRGGALPRVRKLLEEHGLMGLYEDDDEHVGDETHRFYHVDAEDLAEGEFLDVLGLLAPFLRHEGVLIEVTYAEVNFPAIRTGPWGPARPVRTGTIKLDERGWLSAVGIRVSPSLTRVASLRVATRRGGPLEEVTEDMGQQPGDPYVVHLGGRKITVVDATVDVWTEPPKAILSLLNELLTAHGSPERAYGHGGGNDFSIVFATPEMALVINAGSPTPWQLYDGAAVAP